MKEPHKISRIIGDGIEYWPTRREASITGTKRMVYMLSYRAMETYGEWRYRCMNTDVCDEDWGESSATHSGRFVVAIWIRADFIPRIELLFEVLSLWEVFELTSIGQTGSWCSIKCKSLWTKGKTLSDSRMGWTFRMKVSVMCFLCLGLAVDKYCSCYVRVIFTDLC